MAWIKRNLFFVVGGTLALVLLGGAGFLTYKSWSRNAGAADKLNEIYQTLTTLSQQTPNPGNEKINNTALTKEHERDVLAWLASASAFFQPIAGIPPGTNVTSEAYAAALRRTIDALQHEADGASVMLPPKYDFSFAAQRQLVKFAAGSLAPLAQQLGEVKAISEVLFATRINALVGIQRVRVSDDDASGPQSDYTDEQPLTNDLAILTPYVVTFRSFTPELAHVLSAFASSSNTFIVKSINVQPANAVSAAGLAPDAAGGMAPGMPGAPNPYNPYARYGENPAPQPPVTAYQPMPGRGGLQTVLKEQLLQVTMEVEIVKLLPKR